MFSQAVLSVPETGPFSFRSPVTKVHFVILSLAIVAWPFPCPLIGVGRLFELRVTDKIDLNKSINEAIDHINTFSSHHSDAIITDSYQNGMQFITEIDSAACFINASTRFTDGNEFGLGAEMGISNQKLHVRGPMGLKELTSEKYIILGNGQIRV